MKKTLPILAFALALGLSAQSFAGDNHKKMMGGFKQDASQMPVSTVQAVQSMPDESMVALQGNISKRVKKNKYLFNDNTGEIMVEIDGYAWNGNSVSPTDVVTIIGEVDSEGNVNMVEVDEVMMTPPQMAK